MELMERQAGAVHAAVSEAQWQAVTQAGLNASLVLPGRTPVECRACLCGALMAQAPALWARTWDFQGVRGDVRDAGSGEAACTAQASTLFIFIGLQGVAVVVVVLFNTIMKTTTLALAGFERHHSLAGQEQSALVAVFLGQFINTGIISLLVYANISFISDAIKKGSKGSLPARPRPRATDA
jgi:hypothetical protein